VLDNAPLPDGTAVEEHLKPLRPFLDDETAIEICVNRPGEVFVESFQQGWVRHDVPNLTFSHLRSLGVAVATYNTQKFGIDAPLLSATLPGGERAQLVLAPATERDTCALAIRKPSRIVRSLEQLSRDGLFDNTQVAQHALKAHDERLLSLVNTRNYEQFLREAILANKTIVASGATGTGKTTTLKAIAQVISPDERLITIEDVREMFLPNHPNRVHLLYSKGGQGIAKVSPKELLESSLRLRPDRILLAELRGEEAFYFIRNAASGHPSLTSAHGTSPALCFEQIGLMVKESAGGSQLSYADIQRLLHLVIDIVVQFERIHGKLCCTGVYFDPAAQLALSSETETPAVIVKAAESLSAQVNSPFGAFCGYGAVAESKLNQTRSHESHT
jgi:type IV secretion system protein VirB11